MTLDELRKAVEEFFGDTSRPQSETREGLEEIAELCETFAENLDEE